MRNLAVAGNPSISCPSRWRLLTTKAWWTAWLFLHLSSFYPSSVPSSLYAFALCNLRHNCGLSCRVCLLQHWHFCVFTQLWVEASHYRLNLSTQVKKQSTPESSATAGSPEFASHRGHEGFTNDMEALCQRQAVFSRRCCEQVQICSNVVFPRVQILTNYSVYA